MMAHRSSVLAITIMAGACSVEHTQAASSAITGAQTSGPNDFPATGMIVVENNLHCTATLIAPDVALTAAHCLGKSVFGGYGFSLDTDVSDGTDNVIPVKLYHQHPDFDGSVDDFIDLAARNDIAVVILEHPILDVQPEQLDTPAFNTVVDTGSQLSICGYGDPIYNTGELARKRYAQVVVDRVEDYEFSTIAADPEPCNGDSGAPLFVDTPSGRRIVGVVSRAVGRSRMCDTGAIITRVGPYAQWVTQAAMDRDPGCSSAGGGGSVLPLGVLWALHARRRRRSPR